MTILGPGSQLPRSWLVVPFDQLAEYSAGRTPPRNEPAFWANDEDSVPWVAISDMAPFGVVSTTAERVSRLAREEVFGRPPVPKGTLLMSFKLSIGRTAILALDAYHNEAIISIAPGKEVERDFLRFYLPTIDYAQVQDRAIKGNTLNRGKIDALPITLPPIAEQRGIAGVLAKVQRAVEVEDRRIAALKELKAATMAKVFREGLRGEPLKQTEIGEIPESWDVYPLGRICKLASGGTPARDHPEYWGGPIPWVKTGEIAYHEITSTAERITELGLASSAARVFPRGTLLMAMYGQGVTRGKVAFLGIAAATNQACAAFFPDRAKLQPEFLYAFCTFAYHRIRELGHGANQKNLSGEILRGMAMPVPRNLAEQQSVYDLLATIERRIEAAVRRNKGLQALFSSALNQLMTGQVRVTPLLEGKEDSDA